MTRVTKTDTQTHVLTDTETTPPKEHTQNKLLTILYPLIHNEDVKINSDNERYTSRVILAENGGTRSSFRLW